MAESDRTRWEARYRAGAHPEREPDPVLQEAMARSSFPGRALDLACGRGRHAIALARRGYRVDAVDVAPRALDETRRRAAGLPVRTVEADLDVWRPEEGAYAIVVSVDFTDERLVPAIVGALEPGGVLAFAARPRARCHYGPPPGTVLRWFAPLETCLHEETGDRIRYVGRKPCAR